MHDKQLAILDGAARLVKGGGRLVYATCSFLNEENDQVAAEFVASHPDFELVPMSKVLAEQKIALEMGDYLKLLPHKHQTDGFFAAVFERKKMVPAAKAAETDDSDESDDAE
jgi:16S rRNA (cytosine967-C5)-methyltransferase